MKYNYDASFLTAEAENVAEQRLLQNIWDNVYWAAKDFSQQIGEIEMPDEGKLDRDVAFKLRFSFNLSK